MIFLSPFTVVRPKERIAVHNLGTVVRFEVARTLKKKSFWVAALAVPTIIAFVGVIVYFANNATKKQSDSLINQHYSLGVTDDSHIIEPALLKGVGAIQIASEAEGQKEVQAGKLDAYFYYPKNISNDPVRIYGKEVGIFNDSRYQTLANFMLLQSVSREVNPTTKTVLEGHVAYNATTYTNGQVDKGFLKFIAPGIFLVLFYFMIATFGNQILTSVTEEKENRVIEMILATIRPTTLLVGKLISLVVLALTQMVAILVPITVGYFIFKNQLSLPNIDLSSIPLNPTAISLGAVIFAVSYLMYTGLLMTLGAMMPTAKEAGSFFGAIMALTFGPLYVSPLFISSPDSLLVQILSYFPLTAPIPLLLRNAVGNLSVTEALISIVILIATTIFAISIGVRIFRYGALEYSRKLSFKEVFGRKNSAKTTQQ